MRSNQCHNDGRPENLAQNLQLKTNDLIHNTSSVTCFNVNGLKAALRRTHSTSLSTFLNTFNADIVCLQEVKLETRELYQELSQPLNWEAYYSLPSKLSKRVYGGYSGVGTFCSTLERILPVDARQGLLWVVRRIIQRLKSKKIEDIKEKILQQQNSSSGIVSTDEFSNIWSIIQLILIKRHRVLLKAPKSSCDDLNSIVSNVNRDRGFRFKEDKESINLLYADTSCVPLLCSASMCTDETQKKLITSNGTAARDSDLLLMLEEGVTECNSEHHAFPNITLLINILSCLEEFAYKLDTEGRCIITHHGQCIVMNIYAPALQVDEQGNLSRTRCFMKAIFHCLLHLCAREVLLYSTHKSLPAIVIDELESDPDLLSNETLEGQEVSLLIVGDFNIQRLSIDGCDLTSSNWRRQNLPFCDQTEALLKECQLHDTFRYFNPDQNNAFTCWNQVTGAKLTNLGARIDLILASSALLSNGAVIDASIYPSRSNGSDHCPISITLKGRPSPVFASLSRKPSISSPLACASHSKQSKIRQGTLLEFRPQKKARKHSAATSDDQLICQKIQQHKHVTDDLHCYIFALYSKALPILPEFQNVHEDSEKKPTLFSTFSGVSDKMKDHIILLRVFVQTSSDIEDNDESKELNNDSHVFEKVYPIVEIYWNSNRSTVILRPNRHTLKLLHCTNKISKEEPSHLFLLQIISYLKKHCLTQWRTESLKRMLLLNSEESSQIQQLPSKGIEESLNALKNVCILMTKNNISNCVAVYTTEKLQLSDGNFDITAVKCASSDIQCMMLKRGTLEKKEDYYPEPAEGDVQSSLLLNESVIMTYSQQEDDDSSATPKLEKQQRSSTSSKPVFVHSGLTEAQLLENVRFLSQKEQQAYLATASHAPLCKGHKLPCMQRKVKKPGATFGKAFWVCALPDGRSSDPKARCSMFQWASARNTPPEWLRRLHQSE